MNPLRVALADTIENQLFRHHNGVSVIFEESIRLIIKNLSLKALSLTTLQEVGQDKISKSYRTTGVDIQLLQQLQKIISLQEIIFLFP